MSARFGVWAAGAAVFAVSLLAFSLYLSSPGEIYFDETWYVPAARALLATGEMMRQEHPPLGKLLIALSMAIFGDNPIGWRALSSLFGALAMAGLYAWTLAMTRSVLWSLYAAALGLFGAAIYVQARIAMLDMFLMSFGVWAIAFFAFSLAEDIKKSSALALLTASGVCVGLATACKVSGAFLWVGLAVVALMIATLRVWGARLEAPATDDFFSPARWRDVRLWEGALAFALAPLIAYCATYLQQMIHAGTAYELIASHIRMKEIMSGDAGTHPYSSVWWQWPAMIRPVWYYFQIPGGDAATWSADMPAAGVVSLPNPIETALGEVAILFALGRWMLRRHLGSLLVATCFFAQYLPWIINPKGLEFSFYFFPSLLAVGPALTLAFLALEPAQVRRTAAAATFVASLAAFVFFLPVFNAAIGHISPAAFDARMWLSTWR